MVIFFFATDVGKVRKKNEDAFGYFENELFLVADGLGGLPAGEIAAQLAVEKAIEVYQESKNLKRAFEMANHEVYRESRENPAYFGMATTLVGAVIEGKFLTIANVGDSRAYLISNTSEVKPGSNLENTSEVVLGKHLGGEAEIQQLTIDHGLGMGVVTRVIGINPEVKVDIFKKDMGKGDLLLLCTDGLTTILSDEEILRILKKTGKTKKALEKKAKELVKAANAAGGLDNITVCLVKTG